MQETSKAGLLCACALAAMAACGAAQAQTRTFRFNIPAESLSKSLRDFGRTTRQQLVFTEAMTELKAAPAIKGDLPADEALSRILAGSGLAAERTPAGAIIIRPAAGPQSPAGEAATAAGGTELSELTVTGTNIRGLSNPTSPVLMFDREAIVSTGVGTLQDFLRKLPQNFGGGASGASQDGILGSGVNRNSNNEAASGVNLRGLGNKATLVLLDGHRMAPSAFGGFVDISAIPLAAVQRLDVLTDGASSIYGADAVGGVVNLILRKDYDGAETSVRAGTATSGSYHQEALNQLLGKTWSGGGVLADVQYEHQSNLPTSDRAFTRDVPRDTDILPSYEKTTAVLSAHQALTGGLTIYGDALLGRNLLWRKNTQSPTFINYQKVLNEGLNFHGGVRYQFGGWQADLSGTASRQTLWAENTFQVPVPAGYRLGDVSLKNDEKVASVDLNIDGSLFELPGGIVKLALGGSYREEHFISRILYSTASNNIRTVDRNVRAAYAELFVPIVGEANAVPLVRALDLSAAVRYDRYSGFGGTTNPKLGLRWEVFDGLDLRGAWGTSFRAPSADELLNQASGLVLFSFPFTAPNGVGTVPIFIQQGVTSALGPEKAHEITLGIDYRSKRLPGARLQLNFYDIDYTDRVTQPAFDTTALTHPGTYGALISTFANDAEAGAYMQNFIANGGQFFNLAGTTNIRYLYRANTINAASVKQSGLDGSATYTFDRGGALYNLALDAAYIIKLDSRLARGADVADVLNNLGNPNRLRVRGTAGWARGEWQANLFVNYVGPYHNTFSIPTQQIKASTTADLVFGFRSEAEAGTLLHGTSATLAITNIFDTKPPYVASGAPTTSGVHYDAANADPRGRYVSLELRRAW